MLKLSERRTEGSESGSSAGWMTPQSVDSRGGDYTFDQGDTSKPRATLTGQAKWPTPDASVANDGEGLETWLERRERLKESANNGNGCGTPLTMAVQMWPTPLSSDSTAPPNTPENARPLREVAAGWPTPRAMDGRPKGGGTREDTTTGAVLAQENWKTPHGMGNEGPRKNGPSGNELGRQVGQAAPENHSTTGKPHGSLNPKFVAALMGYPLDWLDVDDASS